MNICEPDSDMQTSCNILLLTLSGNRLCNKDHERVNSGEPASIRTQLDHFFASAEASAYRLAYAGVQDEQEALDLVQEAMLKLAEHYRHKPEEQWRALFYTILNNKIRDFYRRRAVKNRIGSIVSLFQSNRSDEPDSGVLADNLTAPNSRSDIHEPELQLHRAHLQDRIIEAMQSLSDKQRKIFLLREIEGISVQETALVTGLCEGTVKQHHFRAMRKLRTSLKEAWHHE